MRSGQRSAKGLQWHVDAKHTGAIFATVQYWPARIVGSSGTLTLGPGLNDVIGYNQNIHLLLIGRVGLHDQSPLHRISALRRHQPQFHNIISNVTKAPSTPTHAHRPLAHILGPAAMQAPRGMPLHN